MLRTSQIMSDSWLALGVSTAEGMWRSLFRLTSPDQGPGALSTEVSQAEISWATEGLSPQSPLHPMLTWPGCTSCKKNVGAALAGDLAEVVAPGYNFFDGCGGALLQSPLSTMDENKSTKTWSAWEGEVADLSKEKGQEPFPQWAFIRFILHRNTGKAHQSLSGSKGQTIDSIQRNLRAYSELGSVS